MRFPVMNLEPQPFLGQGLVDQLRASREAFQQQFQPPPVTGGPAPTPSEFMSHDQWQRTKDARNAYCQAAKRYADASDDELEGDLDTLYDALLSIREQMRPGDRDLAMKYAEKACPELSDLLIRMSQLTRKKWEEERMQQFEEEVRKREPVASADRFKPGQPVPPPIEQRPTVPSPPVFGPRTPEPVYPERISDIAFRPKVQTPGSPIGERLPTDTGASQLPPVATGSRPITPPPGPPVATGGGRAGVATGGPATQAGPISYGGGRYDLTPTEFRPTQESIQQQMQQAPYQQGLSAVAGFGGLIGGGTTAGGFGTMPTGGMPTGTLAALPNWVMAGRQVPLQVRRDSMGFGRLW